MSIEINFDTNICVVLTHEFYKCEHSLAEFNSAKQRIKQFGCTAKDSIILYNCYSQFIHSLYEFFVGCYCRQNKSKSNKKIDYKEIESYIYVYLDKEIRKIKFVKNESSEREFIRLFRTYRNKIAGHASYERATIDMHDFYTRYNAYLLLLYYSCEWFWGESDRGIQHLKKISDFAMKMA